MDTNVQRLRYVLQVLAPAVAGKKATLPILQNIVVGQGRAYATNLETAITVDRPEATDDPVLLPHQQLLPLLQKIPGPTRLSLNREGEVINLAAGATQGLLIVIARLREAIWGGGDRSPAPPPRCGIGAGTPLAMTTTEN